MPQSEFIINNFNSLSSDAGMSEFRGDSINGTIRIQSSQQSKSPRQSHLINKLKNLNIRDQNFETTFPDSVIISEYEELGSIKKTDNSL